MFAGFLDYTEEEYKKLWQDAIFVVDTNILLNFYKYTSKESTKSFFDILKKLKEVNRLWIPHQVALEYFFNFENNMDKQKEGYISLGKELKNLKHEAGKIFNKVKSSHPYILTDKFQFFIENMQKSDEQLQKQLDVEIKNLPNTESIKNDINNLLTEIIGEPFSQERIDRIEIEGKERYSHNIPPGFKDKEEKKKLEYRHYGGIQYQQLYGDLILWNQIIEKAVEMEKPIIFITEEKKEDWWEKKGTQIKRPQPNLIQEFLNKTKQNFYMYRTENFVKFAKDYIGADLTDEQVNEVTKEVENIRKFEEQEEKEIKQAHLETDYFNMSSERNEKAKKLDIEVLMKYLSQEQNEVLLNRIRQAFEINSNPDVSNVKYNNSIAWAIRMAIPQMEIKLQEKVAELSLIDFEQAQSFMKKLASLSNIDNAVERGLYLFEKIEDIERDILFTKELPF
jgi:hypothetical protein